MGGLTRDETAEPVWRDEILRRKQGQGITHFPCSTDHEEDWPPYMVDAQSAEQDDHTSCAYMHRYRVESSH